MIQRRTGFVIEPPASPEKDTWDAVRAMNILWELEAPAGAQVELKEQLAITLRLARLLEEQFHFQRKLSGMNPSCPLHGRPFSPAMAWNAAVELFSLTVETLHIIGDADNRGWAGRMLEDWQGEADEAEESPPPGSMLQ